MKHLQKCIDNWRGWGRDRDFIIRAIRKGCEHIIDGDFGYREKGILPTAGNTCGPGVPFAYAILRDLAEEGEEPGSL